VCRWGRVRPLVDSMTPRGKVAVGALIVATLAMLVAVWWWALLGMSSDVSAAATTTVGALYAAALVLVCIEWVP
jgi:hypothetical protein